MLLINLHCTFITREYMFSAYELSPLKMLHLNCICNIFQNHVCRVENYRKLLELEYHCNSHGKCIFSPCFMILWFYDYKRYQYNFLRVQTFWTYKNQTSKWQRSWVQEAMAEFTGKWKPLEHILCCCAFELFWGSLFSTMAELNLWCKLFIVSLHDQNTKVPQ